MRPKKSRPNKSETTEKSSVLAGNDAVRPANRDRQEATRHRLRVTAAVDILS
jgi:hypothetical protein